MPVRVAINGFGRTGRSLLRALYHRDDIEIVAINDTADPEILENLLRYDSLRGPLEEHVQVLDGYLYTDGRRIPLTQAREPGDVPWFDVGVDVVVETTGRFRTRPELERHLEAGAGRVILTYPPRDGFDLVYFGGVTELDLGPEHRLISCGSSTAHCAALMVKVLDDAFGVETGLMTSIHCFTTEQRLLDVPSTIDLRLSRAAAENVVPVATWSAEAIPLAFPHLAGRFGGRKLNVPVPDASCVDLVTTHPKEVAVEEVNAVFRNAALSVHADVLDYADDPIVSSDVVGSPMSCTFDSLQTMAVGGDVIKTFGWYDQGGCLTSRVLDVLEHLADRRES